MYNDDPLRQPGPHTRSYTPKRWQKPHTGARTHSLESDKGHTHTHTPTLEDQRSRVDQPTGVGAVGCSRSGAARGQRALLEADYAVGDLHGVSKLHPIFFFVILTY